MAIVLREKERLGPGVLACDFEVRPDDEQDAKIYKEARKLECSINPELQKTAQR